jgi:hypothetical protein
VPVASLTAELPIARSLTRPTLTWTLIGEPGIALRRQVNLMRPSPPIWNGQPSGHRAAVASQLPLRSWNERRS